MSKGFLYDTGDELITRKDVNEVPDSSTAQAGDVLSLDSNKKPKWSAPSGGVLIVTVTDDGEENSMVMDKTYSEIYDAVFSNGVVFRYDNEGMYSFLHLESIGSSSPGYALLCKLDNDFILFAADNSSDYPAQPIIH